MQAMSSVLLNPPDIWRQEILEFVRSESATLIARCKSWMSNDLNFHPFDDLPSFPLLPASKGFFLSLSKSLKSFECVVERVLCRAPDDAQ